VLGVIEFAWHLECDPDIHSVFITPQDIEFTIVEFDVNDFEVLGINRLISEIMDNVRTFPHPPIEKN
jgi:hypothetical protein